MSHIAFFEDNVLYGLRKLACVLAVRACCRRRLLLKSFISIF